MTATQNTGDVTLGDLQESPDLATVYQVIKTLYHDANREGKEAASKWLGQLQNSLFAWKIADELLIAKYDIESCYFAAQTLRTKIQTSFHELPAEAYSSLKDSIINHLKVITESVIQTQLALAITYLAILVPNWTSPIEELVTRDLNRAVLVEILTLLPEELDQSRHQTLRGVGANRRQQFTKYLSSISPQIITLLANTLQESRQILSSPNPANYDKVVSKIYRCLGAWIPIIDKNDINLIEPILLSIFNSLRDPNCSDVIHDAAADTICGAALLCEDYHTYQQLTHYLLGQIYQLEVTYHHSVANEDVDKSINYSRIFTEMAESVVDPLIIDASSSQLPGGNPGRKLVDLLLDCIGHYDYEVAEITFHFWYRFSELVNKKGGALAHMFGPVANRLLAGLTKHCQLESDQEGLLNPESDLHDFRLRVRDLVKEMVFIVGASNYIKQNTIIPRIQTNLANLILNPNFSSNNSWEEVEAELFIISCLVRDVYEDGETVAEIINLIMRTHKDPASQTEVKLHSQVLATCCIILGEMSDWLEKNPVYLDTVLNYLLAIITSAPTAASVSSCPDYKGEPSTLSSIAAAALQPIVGCCASKHLVGNWNLITILIQICSQLDLILNENAAHNLLQCCSTIISTTNENQTRQQQEEMIVQLLTPPVVRLKEILDGSSGASTSSGTGAKKDPAIYLDRVAAIFRNLRLKPSMDITPQSLLNAAVTDQLWPLISACLTQYSSSGDSRIVERSCRCTRFVIRCMRPSWLLQPVATSVCTLYQHYPKHSSYLYLASILVDEFAGPDDVPGLSVEQQLEISSGLIQMLNAFCMTTFQLLTAPCTELRNHPDTIDDFFRLCTRFLQKRPENFLKESMLDSILNLTIAAVQLDHREANNSVTKFLIELIGAARSSSSSPEAKAIVSKILNDHIGQKLMDTIMNCALFNLPSYFVPDMADILWCLINWDRNVISVWLSTTLKAVPHSNKAGVISATPEQLQEFYDTVSKANNPKFVAQSLRYLSRLYR